VLPDLHRWKALILADPLSGCSNFSTRGSIRGARMADWRGLGEGESMKSRRNTEKTNGFANLKNRDRKNQSLPTASLPPRTRSSSGLTTPRPPRAARGAPQRSARRSSTSPGIASSAAVASARVSRSIAAWMVASSTPGRCGSVAAAAGPEVSPGVPCMLTPRLFSGLSLRAATSLLLWG